MRANDLTGARAALEANITAIRNRNTRAYLAGYLESEDLVATSPDGIVMGYRLLAEAQDTKLRKKGSLQELY